MITSDPANDRHPILVAGSPSTGLSPPGRRTCKRNDYKGKEKLQGQTGSGRRSVMPVSLYGVFVGRIFGDDYASEVLQKDPGINPVKQVWVMMFPWKQNAPRRGSGKEQDDPEAE
jgi:hypothetical protein